MTWSTTETETCLNIGLRGFKGVVDYMESHNRGGESVVNGDVNHEENADAPC